jgi:hypothetical protein
MTIQEQQVVQDINNDGTCDSSNNDGTCSNDAMNNNNPPEPEPEDGSDLGVPQKLKGGIPYKISEEKVREHIKVSRLYKKESSETNQVKPELLNMCTNENEMCTVWR